MAQFHPLLNSLVNLGPCLGIDLPGCGLSEFSPHDWNAYTIEALTELICMVTSEHCDIKAGQGVVFVGHSLGCSLAAAIASEVSPAHTNAHFNILGLIAICPKASVISQKQTATFRKLLNIPTPIFDLWRRWDRRGGPQSASVARFVGPNADLETKLLQERFNVQSKTAVWLRMAWSSLPEYSEDGSIQGGMAGPEVWGGIRTPVFLVAGEADQVTKPEEVAVIAKALRKVDDMHDHETPGSTARGPSKPLTTHNLEQLANQSDENHDLASTSTNTTLIQSVDGHHTHGHQLRRRVLKTSILPSPASHALLYDHATYRTLAGLIQTFLSNHVDSRLSLGWQLQHLSTEGKWDVKNLAKWQAVKPVSEPIAGIFRAMKTLREIDDSHSPGIFVSNWRDRIKAVVDISHEAPVYDPKALDSGGIEYHKFPTVSKIPPTSDEVEDFIELVDRLRGDGSSDERLIGVHCHYGFNRTGFFICSYLIEKEDFSVQQAIDEFQANRPPGIRHDHFIDTLFVRYCVGLRRAPIV